MTAAVIDLVERLTERGRAPAIGPEFAGPCPQWCTARHGMDEGDGPHLREWNAPHGAVELVQTIAGTVRVEVLDRTAQPGSCIRRYTLDEAEGLRDALTVAIDAAGYIGRHSAETRRRR